MARAVQSARLSNCETVKPEPPEEMWEQLAEAIKDLGRPADPPPNTFQLKEFAQKLKLGHGQARTRLYALIKTGKVEKKCRIANQIYFGLVDDGQPKPGSKPGK